MSGNTITQSLTSGATGPVDASSASTVTTITAAPAAGQTLAQSRAARELELKRGEFDLAVRLGRIRTVPDEGGGGRRVTRAEIDRVRSEDGFPDALRERVKAVGTSQGAALMDVTTARFTRFARLGLVVPVKFYLNRYRAVVWLYLAEELREFAEKKENAPLLKGRTPAGLRDQLGAGLDLRARNWRGRHLGSLLRQTENPWARAAAVASLLDPAQVAEIVTDPYERAHLERYQPDQHTHGMPDSPAARIVARIMTAADPDEISWLRADLANGLEEARDHRPAPRPTTISGTPDLAHHRQSSPGEHRQPAGHRRPVELRRAREPWPPVGVQRPAEMRRPVHVRRGEPRRPAEVRHTIDEPERPKRLLSWLRRRNP
ncbi:DUF6397 family protein [Streptomyces sp. BV286]|uniref:DUF6397 family protein n=1 Tax=Streptomyces sp. BV286 TaxID=2849672 RepID=UPI0020C630AC|nr:DUF6397 family protein [Streptomyces sp. BV286]